MTSNPVPKRQGGFYNHAKEVNEAINGLRNQLRVLEGVNTPEAQAARQAAQNAIQQVASALQGAGI
jgi:filamentous hemagglutinin